MAKYWIQELEEYNKSKDSWCLPRKGTKEYEKIRQVMNILKNIKVKKKKIRDK